MDPDAFEARLRDALQAARDTLEAIEMDVREHGDRAPLLNASRAYARFCMAAREYLAGAQVGGPRPQRLALRVREVVAELAPHAPAMGSLGARLTPAQLERLAQEAEALPRRT